MGLEHPLCERNITAVAFCSNSFGKFTHCHMPFSSKPSHSGNNGGSAVSRAEIIGAVIGVLLFLVILTMTLGLIYKLRKKCLKLEKPQRDLGVWYEHQSLPLIMYIHNRVKQSSLPICLPISEQHSPHISSLCIHCSNHFAQCV